MDADSGYVRVERSNAGWARVVMAREPVNAMNSRFWEAFSAALKQCEEASDVRGIIICSGLKKQTVFSAGNDLTELYAPITTREKYKRFWKICNGCLCDLYTSPLLTVCALQGACPAGGCAIAMCCDYRVMSDAGRIGLNEVELGVPVPRFWAALMARTIGPGAAERMCAFARMASPQEALAVGMVDQVVPLGDLRKVGFLDVDGPALGCAGSGPCASPGPSCPCWCYFVLPAVGRCCS